MLGARKKMDYEVKSRLGLPGGVMKERRINVWGGCECLLSLVLLCTWSPAILYTDWFPLTQHHSALLHSTPSWPTHPPTLSRWRCTSPFPHPSLLTNMPHSLSRPLFIYTHARPHTPLPHPRSHPSLHSLLPHSTPSCSTLALTYLPPLTIPSLL